MQYQCVANSVYKGDKTMHPSPSSNDRKRARVYGEQNGTAPKTLRENAQEYPNKRTELPSDNKVMSLFWESFERNRRLYELLSE